MIKSVEGFLKGRSKILLLILAAAISPILPSHIQAGITGELDTKQQIRYLSFSPDGKFLSVCGDTTTIQIWDVNTGAVRHEIPDAGPDIRQVSFSGDGRYLASVWNSGMINIWNARDNSYSLAISIRLCSAAVLSAAFSPDGRYICYSCGDKNLGVRAVDDGRLVQNFFWKNDMNILHVIYTPDSEYIAASRSDAVVKFFPLSGGKKEKTFAGHASAVNCSAFPPGGKYMATASDDGTVRIWDMLSEKTTMVLNAHKGAMKTVSYSRDGRFLLAAGDAGEAVVWDTATGAVHSAYKGSPGAAYPAGFSSRDYTFAVAGAGRKVSIYSLDAAKEPKNRQQKNSALNKGTAKPPAVEAAQAKVQEKTRAEGRYVRVPVPVLSMLILLTLALFVFSTNYSGLPNLMHHGLSSFERGKHLKIRYVALDIRGFTKADNKVQKLWIRHFNEMLDSALKHYKNYLLILMGDGALVCFIGEKQHPYCHLKFAIDCMNECSGCQFTIKTAISEGDDWLKDVHIGRHKSVNVYGNGIIRASRLLSGAKSEKNQIIVDEISYKGNLGNSKEYKDNFLKNGTGRVEMAEAAKKHEEEIEMRYVIYIAGKAEIKIPPKK